MKRKIIVTAIFAAALISANAALADVSISNGVLDREFDEKRTLYYVQIPTGDIPDIEIDGYETVSKAKTPYSGAALTEENVTVLKNKDTGVKYRFVFEKNGGKLEVASCDLSSDGKLVISGDAQSLKNIKLFILKPTEDFSNEAFDIADIKDGAMEEAVLDVVNYENAEGGTFEYTFPQSAVSGSYRFVLTADGIETQYSTTKFYMSLNDIKKVIADINEKSKFDTENTVAKLREYVEGHKNALYIDMTYYDKLSDSAKNIAIEGLSSDGDYKTLDEIGDRFYKSTAVAWIYDGLSPKEILESYNKYLNLELYKEYSELKSTANVDKSLKGVEKEEEIRKIFNRKTGVARFSEADPSDMKDVLEKYNKYISVEESLYNYFMENTSKCVKEMRDKSYDDTADIEKAIKAVKDSDTDGSTDGSTTGGSKGGSSGGISGGKPSSGGGNIAPITQPKPDTDKSKDDTKGPETPENKLPFTDIDNFEWAYTAIEHLYNNKILNGKSETLFAPNDNITREEFAKLVVSAFGLEGSSELKFKDVSEDAWYREYIEIAVANGVVNGVSEDEFGVGRNITREDMAVMILRAVNKTGTDTDIIIENPAELSDLETVSEYAKEAVEFMIKRGAINGINGEFKPKTAATRAQAAKILYQIIKIR